MHEREYVSRLIRKYYEALEEAERGSTGVVRYCERMVELMVDLLTQLPTRRFFRTLCESMKVVVRSRRSWLYGSDEGTLFRRLVAILRFYEKFEIDEFTGRALSKKEMEHRHDAFIHRAQTLAWKEFRQELGEFALSSVNSVDSRASLERLTEQLSDQRLLEFCARLNLMDDRESHFGREYAFDVLCEALERRQLQLANINAKSLYPDEQLLWDESLVESDRFDGVYALPKLNLQFLTYHDYLLRNFTLYRLEVAYEIRHDLEDAIARLQPRRTSAGTTVMRGWARMALPISSFSWHHISPPRLGETCPASVTADVGYFLSCKNETICAEWDALKPHDIVFLLQISASLLDDGAQSSPPLADQSSASRYRAAAVRGAEILEVYDEEKRPISDAQSSSGSRLGASRIVRVSLDPAQYYLDSVSGQPPDSIYASLNVIVRRSAKENNFKAVLDTIRTLMNSQLALPDWLSDTFLGYGDPRVPTLLPHLEHIDFVDTFRDHEHLVECFPDSDIQFSGDSPFPPPYSLSFKDKSVTVHPSPAAPAAPSLLRFTPTQVRVIQHAMRPGLTMVVGPPGTGKTDVAVQILNGWYHNFPHQRTLLVTHSNNALNQIFEKLPALQLDPKHLIRLGHGGGLLNTEQTYTTSGRISYMFQHRLDLLARVDRLVSSVNHPNPDASYSIETSIHFFSSAVKPLWNKYIRLLSSPPPDSTPSQLASRFPFSSFIGSPPSELFPDPADVESVALRAHQLWSSHLSPLLDELEKCRPFEVLRSSHDHGNYLLSKQAKIVAMTCTHAALKRQALIQLGFSFDNLLMEEAAQTLEIETFIPLLLRDPLSARKLQRLVLIGDHNQLPPVVKNTTLQKFSHLDQSLFSRFVRLGVPTLTLDAQARARASIASLYSWRYPTLTNLDHVLSRPEFSLSNPGFLHEYQFVDVPDFQGAGEIEPTPHYFQNLGEAEFIVATYMYMRTLGYPANKISIITSYNGQKHLIRDIVRRRCSWTPELGPPSKITTVDRFQGQQNDYVLLSLVRTKAVGHIRDVRRLVVSMSRARLGLYVFGRKELFQNCYEITPVFSKLFKRPTQLLLVQHEQYSPHSRTVLEPPPSDSVFPVKDAIHMGHIVQPIPLPQGSPDPAAAEQRDQT
ncbi:RNA helicase aquarius-like [Schistocerca gregaria]|uniref:RNA helicase aquarius-like n=1 Tax=Schistocerca gregaria TaxID=7010 RepID=UPI00211E8C13|nr:RNA helicase aquarius-like [Schistocerca gregaria]